MQTKLDNEYTCCNHPASLGHTHCPNYFFYFCIYIVHVAIVSVLLEAMPLYLIIPNNYNNYG